MHAGSAHAIARGDAWLREHIDGYVRWARIHRSLLIVTGDHDAADEHGQVLTLFVGPMVRPGIYSQRIDHYSVLATILAMYGQAPLGESAGARLITDTWVREAAPAASARR